MVVKKNNFSCSVKLSSSSSEQYTNTMLAVISYLLRGIKTNDLILTSKTYTSIGHSGVYLTGTAGSPVTPALSATAMKHTMNMKAYEQSNHLGNVLVTVSDARIPVNGTGGIVGSYTAIVKSATDYSAFGAPMAGRTYTSTSYRYGFNGKEKDNELHGNSGDAYDFGARILDVRLGRWMSCDPLEGKYSSQSPMSYVACSPIIMLDPDGERIFPVGTKEEKDTYIKLLNSNLSGYQVKMGGDI